MSSIRCLRRTGFAGTVVVRGASSSRRLSAMAMMALMRGGPLVNSIEIRWMSHSDMDAACEVIGLAFADNPNTLVIAQGDRVKAEQMMRIAVRIAKLGRKWSRVLVALKASRIVGVLNAVKWPNCQMRTGEKLRTAPAMIRAVRASSAAMSNRAPPSTVPPSSRPALSELDRACLQRGILCLRAQIHLHSSDAV